MLSILTLVLDSPLNSAAQSAQSPMTDNLDADGYKRTGQLLEPTREQLVRIWWTFWWPTALWTVADKIFDSYQQGPYPYAYSGSHHRGFPYGFLVDALGFLVSVWAAWRAFTRQYPDFQPILISSRGDKPGRVPVDFSNAVRIWWAVCWRGLLWGVPVFLLVFLPIFFRNLTTPYWGLSLPGWLYLQTLVDGGLTYFVLQRYIVDRRFGDFQVRLLALAQPSQANAAAPAPTT
jgi:hypothetical protein